VVTLLLLGVLQSGSALERAAAVPDRFVDITCVLYDRRDGRWCENQAGDTLSAAEYSVADLTALTRHRDPGVRTLALVLIAKQHDPGLLPLVMTLTRDPSATFPAHLMVAHAFGIDDNVPQKDQTVGDVAEAIVRFYLEPAGYAYGSSYDGDCPDFDHYWEQHKDRTVAASWLTIQLYQATQRTSPVPSNREARFAALRRRIEQLPGTQRDWYVLHIGASEGGDRVFTKAETLGAAKALGADRLMAMLDGKEPAFDPDLAVNWRPQSCGGEDLAGDMRRFVLTNAATLLRSTDLEALLKGPDARLALWSIAAASLSPDLADTILKPRIEALDRRVYGWDQAQMAAALVRLGGDAHTAYALDWFYGRRPDEPVTNAQEIFVKDVVDKSGPRGRALLQRLIVDPRFDGISAPALRLLIAQINTWLSVPLVEHPYQSVANEAETHAAWRRLVRDSVPRWTQPR
jgi:hypothetical protein